MGWLFKSDEEIAAERAEQERDAATEEHNRGQTEGGSADFMDRTLHNTIGHLGHSEEYNRGWENGVKDRFPW